MHDIFAQKLIELVRRQIQHMIKYRYIPFTMGKTRYGPRN